MEKYYSNKTLKAVAALRPIDDAFFRLIAKDKAACQEIINTLTDNSFEVLSVTPQNTETSAFREVTLDVLCKSKDGKFINIEVQKGNCTDDVKRCRFHASALTTNHTPKVTTFEDIPDVIILYITEYDVMNSNQSVTLIESYAKIGNNLIPANDGVKIFLANTKVKDDSKKAELLQLFLQSNVTDNEKFPNFCERVKYYKENERGRDTMCKIVEEYAEEQNRKLQQELDEAQKDVAEKDKVIAEKDKVIDEKDKVIDETQKENEILKARVAQLEAESLANKTN